MEENNPNQSINSYETSIPPQPVSNLIKNKKGFFPIILGVLVLLVIVGGGAYYLGTQNKSTKQSTINTPSPTISTQQNNVATSPAYSNGSVSTNWKTYKNTKYGYTVRYPPTIDITSSNPDGKVEQVKTLEMKPVSSDEKVPVETANSICFDAENHPYFGPCPYYISVMNEPQGSTRDSEIYNSLSQPTLDKIFALKVGEELDKKTTQDIGGVWEFPTHYKRLPDEIVNGLNFIVIENPNGYGGSNRILFLRKGGKIYMTGITYQKDDQLKEFQQFYSSLTFSK